MVISWYGEGCFKIQSGEFAILTDPLDPKTGLSSARSKADVVLKTITPFPIPEKKEGENVLFGAGEYNIKDASFLGIFLGKESDRNFFKTIYVINLEGAKICLLGHISDAPDALTFESLEGIDILVIPAGGKPFIDQKTAAKLIKQIQPKIVLPSFFKVPGLKRQTVDVKIFLDEFNHKKYEPQEKLSIKKKDLAEIKSTEIVVLKP